MKRLFLAFPLLKTKRFSLILALLVLSAGLACFLYLPEEINESLPFEEEQSAIEDALAAAEEKLLSCAEEDRGRIWEEKTFYEAALKFRLSPWSSYFAEQALSVYARLTAEGNGTALSELEGILTNRDKIGLLDFFEKYPQPEELDTRLLMGADSPENAGQNALHYEVKLLEEGLETGKDLYFGTEKPLTEKDRALMTRLLEQKENALSKGEYNPVPANRETLLSAERLFACLLSVLLLAVLGYGKKERTPSDLPLFLLPLFAAVLLCASALGLATLIRAPGTAEAFPLQWGGALPFFPALLLRFFCRVSADLPWMLLCFALREEARKSAWKLLALFPVLRFLGACASPLLQGGTARVLTLADPTESIFPTLSAYSLRPLSPWASVFLWIAATGAALFFVLRKEQKLSLTKQKISLEKSNDL